MPREYFGGRVIRYNDKTECTYSPWRTYSQNACRQQIIMSRNNDRLVCKGTDNKFGMVFYIDYVICYREHTESIHPYDVRKCLYRDTYTFDGVYSRSSFIATANMPVMSRRYSV